jgi:hypothetical protein
MSKPSLAPVLLGLLALGGPLRADAPAQEELPVTLSCKPPSFKVRHPPVTFNGTCPLPSGIILRVGLHRISESFSGGQLIPNVIDVGGGNTEIEDKKFTFVFTVDSPGKYMSKVSIPIDLQEKDHAAEVKKRTTAKENWQFEFLVWGDDLVPMLSGKLLEMNALVAEVRDLLKRDEAACTSEQSWMAQGKALTAEGMKLSNKLYTHELRAYFPAAMDNLYSTMRNVAGNAPYYTFGPDGKFSGAKDYHADSKKVSTFRNEDFSWDNLKRYVEESLPCAGREFSLWMVKDLRRVAGQMRSDIQEAVKAQKGAPGVDVYAERLLKATVADLDPLEAEIRGLKK